MEDLDFPENTLVTVTRVKTSANLIESKVYVSVLPEEYSQRVFDILGKIIYGLQQKINRRLRMRPIPKIIFVKEGQIKKAARVEEILDRIKNSETSSDEL